MIEQHTRAACPGESKGRYRISRTALAFLAVSACATAATPPAGPTTAYVNGSWYHDGAFAPRTVYGRGGVIVRAPRGGAQGTVDLAGAFVLPAFAEGHHHTVICDSSRIDQFVDAGVLYAAVMAAAVSTRECQPRMHGAGSVEVVTALAGITAPGAHPTQIGLRWLTPEQLDSEWVYLVAAASDIERIW